ncbi:glycosyltransferase family 4 protein [soil metagenome]
MLKKRVTYIVSNVDKALAFEWIADYLNEQKFSLNFIILNSKENCTLETELIKRNIPSHYIHYESKKNLFKAIRRTFQLLKTNKSDIIHCHLFEACIIGMLAGKLAGIKKRIYTRHHSNYHHIYFPSAVKYDKLINWLSTDIVAISKNVEQILIAKENVSQKKITLIRHGFPLESFQNISTERTQKLKEKHNINQPHNPVVGVIARYTEWKGVQYIIPAFKKLLLEFPDALLVLCNATGSYQAEIEKLLNTLPATSYLEIKFENDIFAMYSIFDIFVHVPIDINSEAFGQTYVEALAYGTPSVFSLSGIAPEFIEDKKNALVVPYKNSEKIFESVNFLLNNITIASKLKEQGKADVNKMFSLDKMISLLENLYES